MDIHPAVEDPVTRAEAIELGRRAWERRAWAEAYGSLAAADREAPLPAAELELLAQAAYLTGRDPEGQELLARAHQGWLDEDDVARAARSALQLSFDLLFKGEQARAGGWLARAQRLLDEHGLDGVERGYLLFPQAIRAFYGGDPATAHRLFSEAAAIADRFHDPDLAALVRMGQGRSRMKLGEIREGLTLLDEVMVSVEAGEVSPVVAGDVYCSVIEACSETFDLRRAQEWTASLSRWCDAQPELVPFRGQCLVRRAEILQLHGRWEEAMQEAKQAFERLSQPPPPQGAAGLALYRLAELHRLRGELDLAEEALLESSRLTRMPRPGLALLRLAQGDLDAAKAAALRLLDGTQDRDTRAQLLPACVEIALAVNDLAAARSAAEELSGIASLVDAPLLHAAAAQAEGAVLLAEGDARAALTTLQRAWNGWHELEAPYEAARVRVLIGLACRELEDEDTATVELEAARWLFQRLGAAADLERLDGLSRPRGGGHDSGLTERELEVLRHVSSGKTNKAIARDLCISEKTVHRHVSNIFAKLGLSTRAAATAWAFQHDLV